MGSYYHGAFTLSTITIQVQAPFRKPFLKKAAGNGLVRQTALTAWYRGSDLALVSNLMILSADLILQQAAD
jgi:hypothetical protein